MRKVRRAAISKVTYPIASVNGMLFNILCQIVSSKTGSPILEDSGDCSSVYFEDHSGQQPAVQEHVDRHMRRIQFTMARAAMGYVLRHKLYPQPAIAEKNKMFCLNCARRSKCFKNE